MAQLIATVDETGFNYLVDDDEITYSQLIEKLRRIINE
mgnify:CR=1 FL=1